jgi:hypothetical protein
MFKIFLLLFLFKKSELITIYSGGCLGYLIDEERSKERYLLWIAELRESSKSWTQPAPRGNPSRYACLSVENISHPFLFKKRDLTVNDPLTGKHPLFKYMCEWAKELTLLVYSEMELKLFLFWERFSIKSDRLLLFTWLEEKIFFFSKKPPSQNGVTWLVHLWVTPG